MPATMAGALMRRMSLSSEAGCRPEPAAEGQA